MTSELSWSLLDPKPVLVYNKQYGANICCWNGIMMTRTYALIVVANQWNNIMPIASVSYAAWQEFTRLYSLGVFAPADWDNYMSTAQFNRHHLYLEKQLTANNPEFLMSLKKQYTAPQAIGWFLNSRQLTIEHNI